MCAHKASGDQTVQSPAPVRMEDPALQRTAHVCVHLGTEGRPAKEVSLLLFLSATSFVSNFLKRQQTTVVVLAGIIVWSEEAFKLKILTLTSGSGSITVNSMPAAWILSKAESHCKNPNLYEGKLQVVFLSLSSSRALSMERMPV